MTSTLTPAQRTAIAARLASIDHIGRGLGTEESPCSIGAINLALTGRLIGAIPPCMSLVIGKWIIVMQDAMPNDMRNSAAWRELLPLAAGTGRDPAVEQLRLDIIMEHMWTVALPLVQPLADEKGFGDAWSAMLKDQTAVAAAEAALAAEAARAVNAAAEAAEWAARAAAAWAARNCVTATTPAAWASIDPPALLKRMVEVGHD